jgi:glucokinase
MRRLGVDVGGTKCLGVAVDDHGTVVDEVRFPTPYGASALVDTIAEIVERLGGGDHVGVGLPGLVTPTGVLRAAPNLPDVVEAPLGELLSRRLGVPVHLDNDATCATLAEWRTGSGRGVHDLMVVTLGTGIGGGLVQGGRLQRGAHGFAGEIGHMVIDPGGRHCGCGGRGCWERYASGSALADHASMLTGSSVTGEDVVRAARQSQPWAREVIEVFAGWVALGLANLANAVDPARFVLGGGLAESGDVLLEPIRASFPQRLYAAQHRPVVDIVIGEHASYAGAIGAALLAETHD